MWADPDRQTGSIAEKNLKASHREIQDCCRREHESERDTTADSLVERALAALPIYLDVFFLSQKTNRSQLIGLAAV